MTLVSVCAPNRSSSVAPVLPTSAVTEAAEAAAWMASASTSAVQRSGRRGVGVVTGVAVEADDGVEVDDAARLVLSDLDEPEADQGAQFLLR